MHIESNKQHNKGETMEIISGTISRITASMLAITMLTSILAGCKGDREGSSNSSNNGEAISNFEVRNWASTVPFDPPEITYLMEDVSFGLTELPFGISGIRDIKFMGDKMYFAYPVASIFKHNYDYGELELKAINYYPFFVNMSTNEITRLPDYKPSVPSEEIMAQEEADSYRSVIFELHTNNAGEIILTEHVFIYSYDLPHNIDLTDMDKDSLNNEYRQILQEYSVIRKLDDTGADLMEPINITETMNISMTQNWFYIGLDDFGNIYIGYEINGIHKYFAVYNPDGEMLFEINLHEPFAFHGFIRLSNGNVSAYLFNGLETILHEINVETGAFDRIIEPPLINNRTWRFPQQGNDEFPILYSTGVNLMGYNPDTGEIIELLNFAASGVDVDDVMGVSILDVGRVLVGTGLHLSDVNFTIFTEVSFEELQDRTILTLAALRLESSTGKAVAAFNRASSTHYIQVIDYSVYAGRGIDGWTAAVDQLSLDITRGKIPDMIAVSGNLPLHRFALMGLFEDLYPFLDADSELNRDSFVEGLLRGIEANDKLYRIPQRFGIHTLIGNPYFLGDTPGWDMDEFQTVLRDNPQADIPLGSWAIKNDFLNMMFYLFNDQFVDWETGTADFDNERFVQFLESINHLPMKTESSGMDSSLIDDSELVATGRQIMHSMYFVTLQQYLVYKIAFGGEIVFKGYPSDNRKGNVIATTSFDDGVAMTVTCSDKNGAWEFISSPLFEEWQHKDDGLFPVNNAAFEAMLERAMLPPSTPHNISWFEFTVPATALTEEDAEKIRELVSNVVNAGRYDTYLWDIVNEEATKFFQGGNTAADAARIIQNRASILMSEQAG